MSEPIRVLIADDHPLFRDGLADLLAAAPGTDLAAAPGTDLAGAAATGTEAVEMARHAQPDVVLMDLHMNMPGLNGIEATRRIVTDSPHITVVILTMFADDDSVFTALRAGARGYLLKGADHEQIRRAVAAAAAGEVIFGAGLATRVLAYFAPPEFAAANAPLVPQTGPTLAALTRAEQAVARLVATGRSNRQVAAELYVSVKTVEFHLGHIFDKLGIRSRKDLITRIGAPSPGRTTTRAEPEGPTLAGWAGQLAMGAGQPYRHEKADLDSGHAAVPELRLALQRRPADAPASARQRISEYRSSNADFHAGGSAQGQVIS